MSSKKRAGAKVPAALKASQQGPAAPPARSGAGPGAGWLPPLLVAALILAAFLPLFAGYNFLPFTRFPNWGGGLAANRGSALGEDAAYIARRDQMPWYTDVDNSPLAQYWPQDLYTARSLRGGRLPLWDPYTGAGMPTLGTGYFHPFNPLRWPFFLIPISWVYSLSLFLGIALGAWGAWLWMGQEGFGPAARAIGAGVFALNPWVLNRIALTDSWAYLLFPWALLALLRTRWKGWKSLSLAALALVAMGSGGHPEVCTLLAAIASLAFLLRARPGGGETLAGRLKGLLLVGGAVAVALAIYWAPLLQTYLVSHSYKKSQVQWDHTYSWWVFGTLASDLFLAPALAALVSVALWKRRPGTAFWLSLAVLSLLLLMPLPGIGYGLAGFVQKHLLFLNVYFKPVLWLAVSFLAAAGFDALSGARRGLLGVAALAGVAALVADVAVLRALPLPAPMQCRFPVLTTLLLGIGLAVALWGLKAAGRFSLHAAACAVLLPLAFPLSLNHLPWNRLDLGHNDAVEWLHRERPHDRTVSIGFSPFSVIPPNLGQANGIRCVEEAGVFFPNSYFQLFYKPPQPPTFILYGEPIPFLFKQAGASVILLPNQTPLPGMEALKEGAWCTAYAVPESHGRLYWAEKVGILDPGQKLGAQISALNRGSDAVALVEAMGQPAPTLWPEPGEDAPPPSFLRDEPERVEVRAESKTGGLLVLKDSWYPGWKAQVDGKPAHVYRVNGCFRGLLLPPGGHTVSFRYRPTLVYAAGAVSAAAILGLVLLAFGGLIRKRIRQTAGSDVSAR